MEWKELKYVKMEYKKIISSDFSNRDAKDEVLRELCNKLQNTNNVDEKMNIFKTEFDFKFNEGNNEKS